MMKYLLNRVDRACRLALLLGTTVWANSAAASNAAAHAEPATAANNATAYQAAAGYKAAAAFSANPGKPYIAHSQQNKLAAATAAQRACVDANPNQDPLTGYCELVQLGDHELTTAGAIKAGIPATPHPLYLWRYQGKNATVYLGGSVHILKTGLYPLPAQFQQAFDLTDHFVVEVNLAAFTPQQLQFKSTQYGMLPDGQQLKDVLSEDTYQELAVATGEYGLPLDQLARFKPSFITQQLAVLALMSVGYDPTQGVEAFFTKQVQGKPILELETLDFQLDLLMNQPLDTQISLVADTLSQMDAFEPFTAELITAWLSGDDAGFENAFDAQSGASETSQAFMRALMDQRNVGMSDKIAAYLDRDGSYFVLVGAAHYIGDNSIIKLLERRGIRGERIYSNQSLR